MLVPVKVKLMCDKHSARVEYVLVKLKGQSAGDVAFSCINRMRVQDISMAFDLVTRITVS